ncbi:MAG: AMP nucleosidase [Alphaproteobacteria bacterium]
MSTAADANADPASPDRITVFAREFGPAAMEYHRREMGRRGYRLAGPIVRQNVFLVDGPGKPSPLLDGEPHYAATFVRVAGHSAA